MKQKLGMLAGIALLVGMGLTNSSALAVTATCGTTGSGVWIDLTLASGGASCFGTGNGTLLNTGATDPVLSTVPGISVLDTTQVGVNGTPTLSVTFTPNQLGGLTTDGTFNFNPAGYTNIKIGFQLDNSGLFDANPDWFVFNLLPPVLGSGGFDGDLQFFLSELPSDDIKYVALYGTPVATPLPAAVWLFGSGLGGLYLVSRRKRKQGSATA